MVGRDGPGGAHPDIGLHPTTGPMDVAPLIGHRGAAGLAPENTLAGLRRAAGLGLRWVELDVRMCAGGRLVLMHDATLERTTNGHGRVAGMAWEVIRRLDASAWYGSGHVGEGVPDLATAMGLADDLGLGVNIEIKAPCGAGAATACAVLTELGRLAPPPGRVLVSSFDRPALAVFAPSPWPLGLLLRRPPRNWRALARKLGVATIVCDQRALTRRSVAAFKSAGLPLVAFTVNDPARARTLAHWGVDSIITDDPLALRQGG